MKRALLLTLTTGLAASWVGCQQATDSTADVSPPATPEAVAAAATTTLVSLKVPNMV